MQALELNENDLKSLGKQAVTAPPEQATEPLPRPFERFTLLSRVARGGMGEVYLASARSIEGAERPLIVKIIRPDHADDRSFVARFLDEARIQAQLQHPGVAQILEATTDASEKPYVVVEYVEGRNLSDVRTRGGQLGVRISWPEALALAVCMGEALTHIHERTDANGQPLEIVHRDLSPQNVMIGYGGEVKLIDFGTARGQNRRCQTISGVVFAKPGYVAPEVANNCPGGVPADLYAYGVILWELLAGRRFLTGDASAHLVAVGAGKRGLPPLARVVGAPPEIDTILAKLTATRLDERYPDARQAVSDIVKLLQRAPSLADGDRSVRGRISDLMRRLYPAEPARSRAEFARRVAEAKSIEPRVVVPPPSPEPPETNDPSLLAGTRYKLLRELGRGAAGIVHEAVHTDLGRTVALKVLESDAMSAEAQSRFRSEARIVAQLTHENLVKVHDFGSCRDGRLFYAMELLEGETLAKRLDRERQLPPSSVIDFGIQACRALEVAHRAGVVHRDIKPENLFVTQAGTLKVLDFGVAKAESTEKKPAGEGADTANAESLTIVGTPEYMAPEQAKGRADARSDVYALGAVLYELLTGELPFDAASPLETLARKAASAPESPSERGTLPKMPAGLDHALVRALDPNPEQRPESAAAFRRELEALLVTPAVKKPLRRRAGSLVLMSLLFAGSALLMHTVVRQPGVGTALRDGFQMASERVAGFAGRVQARRAALIAERNRALPEAKAAAPVALLPAAPEAKPADADADTAVAAPNASEASASSEANEADDGEVDASVASADQTDSAPADKDAAIASVLAEAKALSDKGRELRALELLRHAARQHKNSPAVLDSLIKALQKNRSWGEALRFARRRVELDKSPTARLDLARLERATGHRERALALLNPLAEDPAAGPQARELLRSLTGSESVALRD
ncbi:MAG TPA: protein kinase [Polyangiaceae bacterium]|nr:protein kinase [Polyangiaceae bacterium]